MLTTLTNVKTFLGISLDVTTQDALLNLLLGMASDWIEEYTGRRFGRDSYEEYHSGNGTNVLILRQRPVISIESITHDDAGLFGAGSDAFEVNPPGNSTLLDNGADYALNRDQPDGSSRSGLVVNAKGVWQQQVVRNQGQISGGWGTGNGNYKIEYTAGYAVTPRPLEMACLLAIAKVRQLKATGGAVASESDEQYSISYYYNAMNQQLLSPETQSVLARYKEVSFA